MHNIEVGSSASPGGKLKGCKDMRRSVKAQHGGARGRGGGRRRRIVITESLSQVSLRQNRQQAPVSSRGAGGGERWPDCPNEEKPRWGSDFLNISFLLHLCPHFYFLGARV